MRVDHFAVESNNIPQTVRFYVDRFGAKVLYEDPTWAFLQVGGTKLALVTPGQHPAHLAFSVTEERLNEIAAANGKPVQPHRDGTKSIYIDDPSGNAVELIAYPPGHAYQKES